MNLQQLEYFKKIADTEHYSSAASLLHVSQPCLSAAISGLEKELGVPLFEKNGRNIKLSKYGEIYLTYVNAALDELSLGKRRLQSLSEASHDIIRIGMISSLTGILASNIVQPFYMVYSSPISIEFQQMTTHQLLEAIREEKIDIGFGSNTNEQDMKYFPLYWEELSVIVPNDSPFASKVSINIKDLQGQKFVAYEKSCGIRSLIDSLLLRNKIDVETVCEVSHDAMVVGVVSANLGIAIVPKRSGGYYPNVKKLSIVGDYEKRYIYMIYPKAKELSPQLSSFITFAKSLPLQEIN